MKNAKLKYFLRTVALLCAAVGLLMCLNGCAKKKPKATEPTTEPTAETAPSTQPTTKPTTPPTTPPQPTEPENTTTPSNCKHILGNWIVELASSCTTEGSRYKQCSLCLEKVEIEVIPKTEHTAGNWIADGKPATCTSQGKMKQECSQCQEVLFSITVDKLDHDTVLIEGYAATSTTPGRTDRTYCTTCRQDVQDDFIIPAIGSVEFTYQVTTYNTCTVTGVKNLTRSEVILPEKLGNYTVVGISDNAFANTDIETVYIPKAVNKIGAKAFEGCTNLTNITFQGTTAQWSKVQKDSGWDSATGNYTVYCSNQSVDKK